MLRSWSLAIALTALRSLVAVGGVQQPSHDFSDLGAAPAARGADATELGASAPREALLRAEPADLAFKSHPSGHNNLLADDELSAVISSTGIKYIAPHRTRRLEHGASGRAAAHGIRPHNGTAGLVEAAAPNISNDLAKANSTSTATAAGKSTKPQPIYFAIGLGVFLLALALMALGMKRMNYLELPLGVSTEEASSSAANPQQEDDQDESSRRPSVESVNPTHPGDQIPFRMQQVLISWVFIVASVAYFLDYLALQADFTSLRHWFGVVAALLWVVGFLIHLHWQISVGSTAVQLISSFFKVMACVMGQVHPFSIIMGYKETDPGVWWPAMTGIAFWHIGNIITCVEHCFIAPTSTTSRSGWLAHVNLPVTEMWVDQIATWLLLIASVSITQWWGHPEKQLVLTTNWGVVFCQFGGATFFLMASCIRTEWCNGFRNCSHFSEPRWPPQ